MKKLIAMILALALVLALALELCQVHQPLYPPPI